MQITRKQLKRLIVSSINESEKVESADQEALYPQNMFTPEQRKKMVNGLNELIAAAKKNDADFRATRDSVHQRPPADEWNYIDGLLKDTGMDVNPPKELSVHRVVDGDEGEVLASYLTYDQAVEYGRKRRMIPVDRFDGNKADTPVVADDGTVYFIYSDQY